MTIKLLFVDDNKLMQKCVTQCAASHHWLDIAVVGSARQALELVEQQGAFDVIIADYFMPGMNGIDLLRIFKERHPESRRFLQSASIESNNVSNALNDGTALRFFYKPAMATDINAMLIDACAGLLNVDVP